MDIEKLAYDALESVGEDFETYMEYPKVRDEGSYDLCSLHEYGLSIDKNVDNRGAYMAYVLATGGPHYEVDFWPNGKITFFYAWSGSYEIDITGEDWAQWLRQDFEDLGILDWNFNEIAREV